MKIVNPTAWTLLALAVLAAGSLGALAGYVAGAAGVDDSPQSVSVAWCQRLHREGAGLSCDWDSNAVPVLARELVLEEDLSSGDATRRAVCLLERGRLGCG
ncbi:hypothetical protein [Varibaculum cambriense]|uniref:hypothetical protein n=1 Tax=Varibaculum cambriense TaxID=184870 RepID=UPI002554DAAC|nr:hypothetical protein [Varibaculum cambriense]MDK8274443.1 hypothetical protein [Varibaculum cambriense]